MRQIKIKIDANGKVSPSVKQWGGVQYEHNATEVVFDYGAIKNAFGGSLDWRIDFDSAEAGFDAGGVVFPIAETDAISRAIPQKYTCYSGDMTAALVGTERAPDGSGTVKIVCSIPATIYFTDAERHEETEGATFESLSEMELKVKESADEAIEKSTEAAQIATEASQNITNAESHALETVSELQKKLDNGDFKGEKGDKGDKGEKGDTGSRGADGKDGSDYILTDADKNEIANTVKAMFVDVAEVGR